MILPLKIDSPKIERAQSCDDRRGRLRNVIHGATSGASHGDGQGAAAAGLGGREASGCSVSESSGSFVNRRVVEGSEPAGDVKRAGKAWVPGMAARLGSEETYRLRLRENIVEGQYSMPHGLVGKDGLFFIKEVGLWRWQGHWGSSVWDRRMCRVRKIRLVLLVVITRARHPTHWVFSYIYFFNPRGWYRRKNWDGEL